MKETMLVIHEDWKIEDVVREAKKQWLSLHVRQTDTVPMLARRLGMTYREIRYLFEKLDVTVLDFRSRIQPLDKQIGQIINDPGSCEFCASTEDIHAHHVVNKKESNSTVMLCGKCHRKFHFLNKLYKRPVREPKTDV